jgi:hypothetical protein
MIDFPFNQTVLEKIIKNKSTKVKFYYLRKILFNLKEQDHPRDLGSNSEDGIYVYNKRVKVKRVKDSKD